MSDLSKYEPQNVQEALEVAPRLVGSRLLSKAINTPEAAFAIMATGHELGLGMMASLRSIHIIEGKPTLSADAIQALVVSRADKCEYFRMVESTPTIATFSTKRVGHPSETTLSFTIEEARLAGVTGKDNWRKYPSAMLRARCIAALGRLVYPDLILGVYDPDEIEAAPSSPVRIELEQLPAKDPRPSSLPSEYEHLRRELAAVTTPEALTRTSTLIKQRHEAGTISEGERADLVKLYIARKKALTPPPAPPAPPASDTAVTDEEHAAAIDQGAA